MAHIMYSEKEERQNEWWDTYWKWYWRGAVVVLIGVGVWLFFY